MSLRAFVSSTALAVVQDPELARQFAPLQREQSTLAAVFEAEPAQPLYVFTSEGLCYRASLSGFSPASQSDRGRPLAELIEGDEVCAVLPVGAGSHYLLVTAQGELKRIEEGTLRRADDKGITCYHLELGDRVVAVAAHGYQDHVGLATAKGQLLRLDMSRVRAVQSPAAGGMAAVKLSDGDSVVAAATVAGSHLLTVHASGAAKRVRWDEYPAKGRSSAGVISAAIDKPLQGPGPAGEVVYACAAAAEPLLLFSQDGELVSLSPAEVVEGSRFVVSRPALKLVAGGRICGHAFAARD